MYRYDESFSGIIGHDNKSELDRYVAARNEATARKRAQGGAEASPARRPADRVGVLLRGWFGWTRAIVR
jgi:hypothetical protein